MGRQSVQCGKTWSLVYVSLWGAVFTWLTWITSVHLSACLSEERTMNRGDEVGWRGVGIKERENMIHGGVGPSRDTAADLQSEGRWTETKALFRQSECSVSCDGWRWSVWEPLSRCVSRSHLQASTVNRDQMADARGPSGTCALRHTNDYGCRPINGHICKGEQQPAHWEWVSSFRSPLEHRHAGVNVGKKNSSGSVAFPSVQVSSVQTATQLRLHPKQLVALVYLNDFRKLICEMWTLTHLHTPAYRREIEKHCTHSKKKVLAVRAWHKII